MRYLVLFAMVLAACGGQVEPSDGEHAVSEPQNPRCMTFHNTWECAAEPFEVQTDGGLRPCSEGCAVGQACVLADHIRDGICR